MNMRKYRDLLNFFLSLILIWLYIPHLLIYFFSKNKNLIDQDLNNQFKKIDIQLTNFWGLLFFLHSNSYYRKIFYHRIGIIPGLLVGWWRPGCKYFKISLTTKIDGGLLFAHPYSTILNAESIGKNFSFRHLTTIGNKGDNSNRPIIGDNVTLGATVTIIGKINIGNNVIIGAGSVITKNIPSDCTVVGNPARIIRRNGNPTDEKL